MDIRVNTEFEVKFTPNGDTAPHSPNLPNSIEMEGDLVFNLAPMHQKGIITVLHPSKYASLLSTEWEPQRKK